MERQTDALKAINFKKWGDSLLPYVLVSSFVHAGMFALGGIVMSTPPHAAVMTSEAVVEVQLVTEVDPPDSLMTSELSAQIDTSPAEQKTSNTNAYDVPREPKQERPAPSKQPAKVKHAVKPWVQEQRKKAPEPKAQATETGNSGEQALPEEARGVTVSASPDYFRNPPPSYPEPARRRKHEGVVLLRVGVSENGLVTEVQLTKSSGFKELDEAALNAVKRWTFKPGTVLGRPVASQVEVPIRFELKSQAR